ncbi:hypothetical protein FSP39_010809 [Pinctada imbricata]|uniref:28S ribosomal protein S14, mitochondrial n=1 Tax=Pinctada imbricata TaxID=66713 RepID=A0AA88XUA0_PINIB|nr:hypothetical protein FSP39_010809 [Pinctada imbricata]
MHKDNRRRKTFEEHAPERLRINAIRKNTILPKEIREMADKEIKELPLDSSIVRLHKRCILTSRPRGNVKKWRISRIMFRSLADYNKLPGVTRAVW